MANRVFKYKVFCETDNKWEHIWLDESDNAPSICPVNPAHTIDLGSVSIDEEVASTNVQVIEQTPFAKPDYRTKMDAIPSWVTCSEGVSTVMDFTLTSERYVTGGEIIFKNAKEGDYITACVYDGFSGGVIPEAYRTELCEAWPIVATYVEKRFLVPTIADGFGILALDTYPLNAKISQYLQLRVTYYSSAEVGDRRVTVNYNLTQKL